MQGHPVLCTTVQLPVLVIWQELFAPTQHDSLHDLPATDWQQWFDTQLWLSVQPVQPVASCEPWANAGTVPIVVTSDPATADATPAKAVLRTISRREKPLRSAFAPF